MGIAGEADLLAAGCGHEDRMLRPVPRPLRRELARNVVHLAEHVANGQRAEVGDQYAVRDAPVALLRAVGGAEAIVHAVPCLLQGCRDDHGEAVFVAYLVHQGLRADDDTLFAAEMESPDWACLGQPPSPAGSH